MHNTNATADVSPCDGISAILGQHKARAQIAMIMNGRGLSPPPPFGLRSLYTHTSYHLTWHTAPMMHRSHKLATMSSYSGCPLRLFRNGPSRIRLCRTVPRVLAYLATTWRSRQYLLLTIPKSKNASTVMYATSITISGSKNAKIQPSKATWQNSPTRKCARPSCTLCPRRLAEASLHDKLWGIGLTACDPESTNASTVMYSTSITISGSKNAKIQPSEATWQNSPRTRKCTRPSCTLCPRCLAEASPHDKLWGIGLSACDSESTNASTVMCTTLATTSCKKDCEHIAPRGNIVTFSQ